MPQPPVDFITRAPRDVASWVRCLDSTDLPVLAATAETVEELRAIEDVVDAHMLADAIADDPLMVLKIMAHVARVRRGRDGTEPETVTAALVMLGIPPFFSAFGQQARVDAWLRDIPGALDGFLRVLERSRRAATFALAFAVQRMDHDAAVIRSAALLHDFAELLLWLRAPTLALDVCRRLQAQPGLRSAVAQVDVLNVPVVDIQHALMVAWRLPRILIDITDDHRESLSAQARTVTLAIRLARHTAGGWDDPAVPDDVRDIAELLHMAPAPTLALLRDLDPD